MRIIPLVFLSVQRASIRASWSQAHAAWAQTISTGILQIISIIIAIIWLIVHLYSKKCNWKPELIVPNSKKIYISVRNLSNKNANDIIKLSYPIYVHCDIKYAQDVKKGIFKNCYHKELNHNYISHVNKSSLESAYNLYLMRLNDIVSNTLFQIYGNSSVKPSYISISQKRLRTIFHECNDLYFKYLSRYHKKSPVISTSYILIPFYDRRSEKYLSILQIG